MRLCPKCGSEPYNKRTPEATYKCKGCKHHYSDTSGTVFHARKLPINKINKAIQLVKERKNAYQISKILKVQYSTACNLYNKIMLWDNGELNII